MTDFVSLHNQTDFSILDSLSSVKDLLHRAKELGQSAIAITDHGSIASAWDALKASKDTGVKLIIGCEYYFQNDISQPFDRLRHLVLIAKSATGYKNLLTLNKKGFDQGSLIGKRVYSIIDWKLLEQYSDELICLTACGNGIINQLLMNNKLDEAEVTLLRLKSIFNNNLGLEILPNNMKRGSNVYNDEIDQKFLNHKLIEFGKKYDIRVVPACNSHYIIKEDHETHDVLLSIGSHQPVHSNYRLRYPVPDFYLKSGEEVHKFFSRNYGEEYADQLCANSIYFAEMCENPVWIDPKFSNPSGKELPIFPVKDELDYLEFLEWDKTQSEEVRLLDEDKRYLRFLCNKNFDMRFKDIPDEKIPEYHARIVEELDILEYQGFSSYMLIVYDFLRWSRKNNIEIGPGRGCVDGDTLVLTDLGYKKIKQLSIGDFVFTHDGTLKVIKNTFSYDINEKVIELKSQLGYSNTVLTKDHKVCCSIFEQYNSKIPKIRRKWNSIPKLEWISAENLTKNHLLWNSWITFDVKDVWNNEIDLTKFVKTGIIKDNYIEYKYYEPNVFSLENISINTGIPKHILFSLKKGKNIKNKEIIIEKLNSYLLLNNISFLKWKNMDNVTLIKISKAIKLDIDFYYFIGLWVGDGFLKETSNNKVIGISFHENEIDNAIMIKKYLAKYGFKANIYKKKNEKAIQLEVNNEILLKLIKFFINKYENKSNTKHLPFCFRNLSNNNLFYLIKGVFDSDGHSCNKNKESIKTTSFNLVLEIKESLLALKHPSSISDVKTNYKDGLNRKKAYTIYFPALFDNKKILNKNFYKHNGYYSRIIDINEKVLDKVYDIQVDENHNYMTTNLLSHNSVGGSLVAYLLNIHEADSIKYDLIFARFQNRERSESPDIDNDISAKDRNKLISYIINKYGEDNVAAISNINTITPKVYARDIARSCELGGSREKALEIGNFVADTLSADIKNINEALVKSPLFSECCKKYQEYIKYKNICSKFRAFSTHAAGIIISQRSLTGLVPLRKDKDNINIIEYDKDNTEKNGLIKIDLLGLSTLDLMVSAANLIKENNPEFSLNQINANKFDEKTYNLISKGDTFGVFQFGTSGGTIDLCKKIKPKSLEDLAIITTLARPGAKEIRDDFIATRNGKKEYSLLHPSLKNAFEKTYGFGLFDESILQLAKDVAGWSLHSADRIRKMIKGKGKNPELNIKLREEFIRGAINNGINEQIAPRIWDEEIKKFANYTFNKSHAILYSMISFKTAYLKAHYPIEFLLANLMHEVNSNAQNAKSNIEKTKHELRFHKVKIIAPSINESKLTYTITEGNKLITGLDALKFVGDEAIKDIIEKRPFNSFFDFMVRVDSKKVRANNIQALAASGCLDDFKISRKLMYLYCADYRKKLQVWCKKHDPKTEEFVYPWTNEDEWTIPEIYALEQFYLGESFICKTYQAHGKFFANDHNTIKDIKKSKDKTIIPSVIAIVKDFFEFKVKKETSKYYGQSMIKAVIEDMYGEQCFCTIFPDRWQKVQDRLKQIHSKAEFEAGLVMRFSGNVNTYDDNTGIILDNLYDISMVPALPADLKAKKVNLKVAKSKLAPADFKNPNEISGLQEEIEDELYDEGLIDLDEESYD